VNGATGSLLSRPDKDSSSDGALPRYPSSSCCQTCETFRHSLHSLIVRARVLTTESVRFRLTILGESTASEGVCPSATDPPRTRSEASTASCPYRTVLAFTVLAFCHSTKKHRWEGSKRGSQTAIRGW
jgi:hypothetical protein